MDRGGLEDRDHFFSCLKFQIFHRWSGDKRGEVESRFQLNASEWTLVDQLGHPAVQPVAGGGRLYFN